MNPRSGQPVTAANAQAPPDTSRNGLVPWPLSYRAVFAVAVLLTGVIYLWCARAANGSFDWRVNQPGYYDLLAASFVAGHLYLPIEPSPELLAAPDPWDPQVGLRYGAQDLAFYNRRYYLYHGVTPAWLLFTPYRFLTRRHLPEPFAAALLCWLAYVFGCATLMRLLAAAHIRPPLALFALLMLVMALCQSAPYLLQRVQMYEIAIAGGYFCLSAGFWFLARFALGSRRGLISLALAGLFLGLAPGSRPDLVFAALAGAAFLIWYLSRQVGLRAMWKQSQWWAFALPMGACALLLALYNYGRFHDPLEFGTTWQLAPPSYFRPAVALHHVLPGLYYLLASTPAVENVFPFFRFVYRLPFNNPHYPALQHFYAEPIVGIFVLWPLTVLLLVAPWIIRRKTEQPISALLWTMASSAGAALLLTAALGLATPRFQVDWLPYLLLISLFVLAVWLTTEYRRPISRHLARAALVAMVVAMFYSIVVNVALDLQGPYDTFVEMHPQRYVKYAAWFSPVPRLRPLYDPRIAVEASFDVPADSQADFVPLVSAGRIGSRYLLSGQVLSKDTVRLTSSTGVIGAPVVTADVTLHPGAPNRLRFDYEPRTRTVTVRWNGQLALQHVLPFLVTAPVQVRVGEDRAEFNLTPFVSPWRFHVLIRSINGLSS